jgi:hypothetical protein
MIVIQNIGIHSAMLQEIERPLLLVFDLDNLDGPFLQRPVEFLGLSFNIVYECGVFSPIHA